LVANLREILVAILRLFFKLQTRIFFSFHRCSFASVFDFLLISYSADRDLLNQPDKRGVRGNTYNRLIINVIERNK